MVVLVCSRCFLFRFIIMLLGFLLMCVIGVFYCMLFLFVVICCLNVCSVLVVCMILVFDDYRMLLVKCIFG